MIKKLIPYHGINYNHCARPIYLLHDKEKLRPALEKLILKNLLFIMKIPMSFIYVDVDIDIDERTILCIAQEETIGVVTSKNEIQFCFEDRVILSDDGHIFLIHIGGLEDVYI